MELNKEQQKAVEHLDGPMLVLAGAGSGKTRVVTNRISKLIERGLLPTDIVAVTFTNKAAEEMKSRVFSLTNASVLTCTFHSLGARILRESIHHLGFKRSFVIYDEEDSFKLLKNCLEEMGRKEDKGTIKSLRAAISSAKNDLNSPDELESSDSSFGSLLADIYTRYQHKLKECGAVDFDDLLYLTVRLFESYPEILQEYQNRWLYVLIDEYQDTNFAQYRMTKLLVEKHQNIFAVGDPDQSIYSWRGARYQNILNFGKDFPGAEIVRLEQNYRSTSTILEAANSLIEHNSDRYDKNLWSALGKGEKVTIYNAQNEKGEAYFVLQEIEKHLLRGITLNNIVIFYRTNAQSRIFEDLFLAKRIPYQIIGGISFYDRREVKDILAYLRIALSGADLISFVRTINLPKRGLGPQSVQKMQLTAAKSGLTIVEFLQKYVSDPHAFPNDKFSTKQLSAISDYLAVLQQIRKAINNAERISDLILEVMSITQYESYLREDPDSYQDRKENIEALISKAGEWEEEAETPSLATFLEELSLNRAKEENRDSSIKLMTLHNGKGLEFDLVFLAGMEEDLLPHINSKDSPSAVEEERRLCYVGMTRARKKLYLLCSTYRYLWGSPKPMSPSRFLREIPHEYLENLSPSEYISEEVSREDMPFRQGDRVNHREFGVGTVQRAYHTSYGATYDVYFEEFGGTRSLVAKYAKLEPC